MLLHWSNDAKHFWKNLQPRVRVCVFFLYLSFVDTGSRNRSQVSSRCSKELSLYGILRVLHFKNLVVNLDVCEMFFVRMLIRRRFMLFSAGYSGIGMRHLLRNTRMIQSTVRKGVTVSFKSVNRPALGAAASISVLIGDIWLRCAQVES